MYVMKQGFIRDKSCNSTDMILCNPLLLVKASAIAPQSIWNGFEVEITWQRTAKQIFPAVQAGVTHV